MTLACRLPDGYVLHAYDRLASTNDLALALAREGARAGQVVVAGEQTRGRGRHGRAWASPPGNLYASVLLRPACTVAETAQLSLIAGLALVEALEGLGLPGPDLALKWPNDVLLRGAKVAGILLESAAEGDGPGGRAAWVVVGTGVNLVSCPADLPYPATTLRREGFAADLTPARLLETYVLALDGWLGRWRVEGFAGVRAAWRRRSYRLGDEIHLRLARGDVAGRFVDLTASGALLLEHADGGRREITAGEVFYGRP